MTSIFRNPKDAIFNELIEDGLQALAADGGPVIDEVALGSIMVPSEQSVTINGLPGNETINGTNQDDSLSGAGGDDQIFGRAGSDTVSGGQGADDLRGNNGDDVLYGDDGADSLFGHNGADTLFGGSGANSLSGGNDDDVLFGGGQNDSLRGGLGDDVIYTNSPDAATGTGVDVAFGGGGDDTFHATGQSATLFGGTGHDQVFINDALADVRIVESTDVRTTIFTTEGRVVIRDIETINFLDATLGERVVAAVDFDGGDIGLVGGFDPATDNQDGGPGDFFGVGSTGAWPQAAGVPFSLADDSVVSIGGSIDPFDDEGVFGQNRDGEDDFFGMSDLREFDGGSPSASWTFDISGAEDLVLQIDMGGISNASFGGFGAETLIEFTYSIDGGPEQTAFLVDDVANTGQFTTRLNDAGNATGGGALLEVTGGNAVTKLSAEDGTEASDTFLDKSDSATGELDTFLTSLTGSGARLTLTMTATMPFEAMAFDNIKITGGAATPKISEFQPNPDGQDPGSVSVELSGNAGESFDLWLVSIEDDGDNGLVDRAAQVTGTFDANGLAEVTVNDLENPSFTYVLTDSFSGAAGTTDIDTNDDGVIDDVSAFGTILDAVGIVDDASETTYADDAQFGGTTIAFTGAEPELVFRSGSFGEWFAVNAIPPSTPSTEVYRADGTVVAIADFDTDPTAGTTFGDLNPVFAPDPLAVTDVFVHQIQGSTNLANGTVVGTAGAADESPLLGDAVRIQGVVTASFPDLGGFYVQEEDADIDGDDSTSEGIFVVSADSVTIGDIVTVEGTVAEREGETALQAVSTSIDGTDALPTATVITFPTATVVETADGDFVANLEAYEGMLVTIPEEMTVTELFQLDRFGTMRVSSQGRLEQFTQSNTPDATGFAQHLEDINARTLVIDDGSDAQNPYPLQIPGLGTDGQLDAGDVFRMGDVYTGITGIVSYSEDDQDRFEEPEYRIHTPSATLTQDNPRPATPEDVGSDYKVASLNVLNFFTTLDEFPSAGEGSGPNGLSPRGADANPQNALPGTGAQDEYDRQLSKLVEQIVAIDSDVIGLVEVENDFATGGDAPTGTGTVIGSGVAIDELVDAVNAVVGAGTYDWVRPAGQTTTTSEFLGGDAIAVGFIYDTTTTGLVGDSAALDTEAFIDPNDTTSGGRNRAALAQTFEELSSGETFTASVNHFKSKGDSGLDDDDDGIPDTPGLPDNDQFDGAGYWNDTRTKAAQELADWLATDPTGSGDEDVIILGDLNAYANETPITTLEGEGYTDLAEAFIGADAYSFVFDGQQGTLDYALANAAMLNQVTGVTEWHANADEPDAFDYNLEFNRPADLFTTDVDTNVAADPFRASDHDPVIVGLDLGVTTSDLLV